MRTVIFFCKIPRHETPNPHLYLTSWLQRLCLQRITMGSLLLQLLFTCTCIIAVELLLFTNNVALAFIPHQSTSIIITQRYPSKADGFPRHNLIQQLSAINNNKVVEITYPTPEEAASMGIRDWPQQFHSTNWSDMIPEGGIATRYVIEGKGRITVDYYEEDDLTYRKRINQRVYPGTLVEVDGEANILWEVDDSKEGMIILTPGYEEGGKLLTVGGFLVLLCTGLLFGSGLV